MTGVDFTGAHWRKSSYSGGGGNAGCVSMAWNSAGSHVGYRDTKDLSESTLVISAGAHRRFIAWAARRLP